MPNINSLSIVLFFLWLVVISSNLNVTLRLFFCPNNNNLPLKICCKNVIKILWIYHFYILKSIKFGKPRSWEDFDLDKIKD